MPPRSGKESSADDELTKPARTSFLLPPPATALQTDRDRFERALSAARAANDAERASALAEATPGGSADDAAAEAMAAQAVIAPQVVASEQTALIAAMPEHLEVSGAGVIPRQTPDRAPDDLIVQAPPALPRTRKKSTRSQKIGVLLVGLGALGLLCSVVLAVGALLAAIEVDVDAAFAGAVSDLCDLLVGPLGGLFSFSGDDAQARNDLFARGIGSMIYLAIGLFLPSVARRRDG